MINNSFNTAPNWIEVEDPEQPNAIPLQQLVANKLYEIGINRGYQFLPKISGTLSTTFSHPVFAMPHLDVPVHVHGFHTAFRPTDNDEGTHLVAFGQYYICTNVPLSNQFEFIKEIFLEVIDSSFPSDFGLTDIKLEEGCYEWRADSTGYKGGGGEVNVTSIMLDGKEHKIGRLELAQINDYAISGDVQGNPCHLIVFGIDRLINLCAIIKAIKQCGEDYVAHMPIHELYMMEEKDAALHKGLVDAFRSIPKNGDAILASIYEGLSDIEQALEKSEFNPEVFARLGQVSSLAECAYASNVITRDYRQYLIHKLSQLYAQFAKDIAAHPQTHLNKIERAVVLEKQTPLSIPSIFDVLAKPFFKHHFSFAPRALERIIHEEVIPPNLIKFFLDEEIIGGLKLAPPRIKELKEKSRLGSEEPLEMQIRNEQRHIFSQIGNSPDKLPQFLLKKKMFCRVIGEDLAHPVESLAHPTKQVMTLAGSIADRLIRMDALLDHLRGKGLPQKANVNYGVLKKQLRYLAVEWQYRSIKIYPQLEGLLGAIAMQQQGYDEQLTKRIQAFHLAGTKRQISAHDPETLLLILVGKLDEAVSLFVRSTENGRSASSFDPFGIRPKLSAVAEAAKTLGFGLGDIKALLCQIAAMNPDAVGNETRILNGYLWSRIEKAFSPAIQPKAGPVALKKIPEKSKSFFGLPKDAAIETYARRAN